MSNSSLVSLTSRFLLVGTVIINVSNNSCVIDRLTLRQIPVGRQTIWKSGSVKPNWRIKPQPQVGSKSVVKNNENQVLKTVCYLAKKRDQKYLHKFESIQGDKVYPITSKERSVSCSIGAPQLPRSKNVSQSSNLYNFSALKLPNPISRDSKARFQLKNRISSGSFICCFKSHSKDQSSFVRSKSLLGNFPMAIPTLPNFLRP